MQFGDRIVILPTTRLPGGGGGGGIIPLLLARDGDIKWRESG